jgi:hypothetical protein
MIDNSLGLKDMPDDMQERIRNNNKYFESLALIINSSM